MNELSRLIYKAIFTLFKRLPGFRNLTPKIRSGFLKGMRWSASVSDTSYLVGTYEEDAIEKFQTYLKPGGALYDIGANAGYFSLVGAKLLAEGGKVYAFEPMPDNLALLHKHLKINQLSNVEVLPLAVNDKGGTLTFTYSDNLSANTYVADSPMFNRQERTLQVESTSLDQFMESQSDLTPPTLIKIDVEGAEYDVLVGAKNTLIRYQPAILLATHDNHLPGVKDQCLGVLSEIGYEILEVKDNKIPGQQDFLAVAKEDSKG